MPDDVTGDAALHLRHRADPAELHRVRAGVDDWAVRHAVPEDTLVDLQLALGEAVANGVEHAYCGVEPGMVSIDVAIRQADGDIPLLAVRVTDHGTWRAIPLVKGHRGRGLNVIRYLARHVEILRTGHGTQISFEIPLG